MSVRDYLYENFENFDKPTEDDFKVFIDFAGEPTTFMNRTVAQTSDILTDLNSENFLLGIRDTYLIFYGTEVYILFGLEGSYGLGGTTITGDYVALVGNSSSGSLSDPITVTASIEGSGIDKNTVFPTGTSFEDMWRSLLIKTTLTNLHFEANNITGFSKVGDDLTVTKFLWESTNTPANLYLEDSEGQYGSTVTGNQITVNETYTYSTYKEITWDLSSTDTGTTSIMHYWVEPSYHGRNLTGNLPTAIEIENGMEVLTTTEDGITIPINTTIQEYGWIAVENIQTAGLYTTWEISDFNTATIKATSFVRYAGNVVIGSKDYNVYIYNYPSQVTSLKLY